MKHVTIPSSQGRYQRSTIFPFPPPPISLPPIFFSVFSFVSSLVLLRPKPLESAPDVRPDESLHDHFFSFSCAALTYLDVGPHSHVERPAAGGGGGSPASPARADACGTGSAIAVMAFSRLAVVSWGSNGGTGRGGAVAVGGRAWEADTHSHEWAQALPTGRPSDHTTKALGTRAGKVREVGRPKSQGQSGVGEPGITPLERRQRRQRRGRQRRTQNERARYTIVTTRAPTTSRSGLRRRRAPKTTSLPNVRPRPWRFIVHGRRTRASRGTSFRDQTARVGRTHPRSSPTRPPWLPSPGAIAVSDRTNSRRIVASDSSTATDQSARDVSTYSFRRTPGHVHTTGSSSPLDISDTPDGQQQKTLADN